MCHIEYFNKYVPRNKFITYKEIPAVGFPVAIGAVVEATGFEAGAAATSCSFLVVSADFVGSLDGVLEGSEVEATDE